MARGKDTRQRIINTSMELFWANSFETVGTDLICKEANVRKGSLYHFFPSKDVLAMEVINERWRQFECQVLKLAFDENTPPLKRFERYFDLLSSMAVKLQQKTGEVYGCPLGNFALELSTLKADIRVRINDIFEQYTQYFKRSLENAVAQAALDPKIDIDATAHLLFAGIEGIVLIAKTKNDAGIMAPYLQHLFKMCVAPYSLKRTACAA